MTINRAAEMLAMLAAKTGKLEIASRQYGAVTREDVALALALVQNKPGRLLARIKYADQVQFTGSLENELLAAIERGALSTVVSNYAAPQRWRIPRPGFIRDMCRLALFEALALPICQRCRGRKHVVNLKGVQRDCPRCLGTGRGQPLTSYRWDILGISRQSWHQHWKDRYSAIQALLDRCEGIALGGMRKRLVG